MSRPVAFTLTDEEFDAACKKLETIPREQWPSEELWEQIYISCRMKAMENAEREVAADLGK